jgi:hypothetical protein
MLNQPFRFLLKFPKIFLDDNHFIGYVGKKILPNHASCSGKMIFRPPPQIVKDKPANLEK